MGPRVIKKTVLLPLVLVVAAALCVKAGQGELPEEDAERKERLRQTVLLPFKYITDFGADNGELNMVQIRPLYTISSRNWNFINRPIIPYLDISGTVAGRPELPSGGGGEARGLGDISYTVAVEARKLKPVSVAAGLAASFPTASEDTLGSGKWSAGPALMVLTKQDKWSMLLSARQIWSFAGDAQRADVNNFAMEPIFTRQINTQWYLVTDPVITANWELDAGDRWLIPMGGGTGYHFKAWDQPIDLRLEAYYNVVKSKNAPDWSMAATFTLIFQ